MRKLIQVIAWLLVIFGAFIVGYFIHVAWVSGYRPWEDELDMPATGEFGDFVGGFVGTIISAAGFLFLYLTLKEQRESFAKERFENNFFELLKLHRDNVAELKYKKQVFENIEIYEDREVFKILFQEFLECLQDVRRFSNSSDLNDYIAPVYRPKLQKLINSINPRIDIIEFVTIDISYFIFFNGVDEEGASILRTNFRNKYNNLYFHQLIKYIQLKPKKENATEYANWLQLQKLTHLQRRNIVDELYNNRRNLNSLGLSADAKTMAKNLNKEKYYSGHHFRLGHYFRHLFQCYKYLNGQAKLKQEEKYFFGKTLRAQLSTYEQAFLFVNSLTNLGLKWEFVPEIEDQENKSETQIQREIKNSKMITNYNLIKNLPGKQLFGISYKKYYPNVKYEVDEQ